jgi:DNA mismatch endonuclease (patch repair protein)
VADIVDKATRSRMMAGIRSTNTKGEVQLRSALHRLGFRFRLHDRKLPGRPDIVLPKYRSVILINGCFWHGHTCSLFKWPSTREDFWRNKIESNVARDQSAIAKLIALGWRVGVIWECSWKGRFRMTDEARLAQCTRWLKSDESSMELTELR